MKTPDGPQQPFSSSSAIENSQPQEPSPLPPTARDIFAINARENQAPVCAVKGARARKTADNSLYKPGGRIAVYGLPLLALWVLPASALLGYAYWQFTQQWNPVMFAQIFLGFALGAAMFPAVRLAKCRNPKIAVGAAVLLTLLTFLMWHALEARAMRAEYVDYFTKMGVQSGVPEMQARARVEKLLTPARSTRAYLREVTDYGILLREDSNSRLNNSQSGTRVAGVWYWLLSALETVLAAFIAGAMAHSAASARFSEARDRWHRRKKFASVAPSRVVDLLDSMKAEHWREAGQLMQNAKTESSFQVVIYDCPPASAGFVALTQTANNQTTCLYEAAVSQENIALLRNPI